LHRPNIGPAAAGPAGPLSTALYYLLVILLNNYNIRAIVIKVS